jgi:hypothetical protein
MREVDGLVGGRVVGRLEGWVGVPPPPRPPFKKWWLGWQEEKHELLTK